MRPNSSTLLPLSALITPLYAINTWEVAFWSGAECTSQSTGIDQGPKSPQVSRVCNPIPNIGFTQTLDYRVGDGGYTFILGLHKTDDCSYSGSSYQGTPDSPICESTSGGYTHYSTQTVRSILKEKRLATIDGVEGKALEKRQNFAALSFALVASGYAANFITDALDVCGDIEIDSKNMEYYECGAKSAFATLFPFVTAYGVYASLQGARQTPAQTPGKRDLGEELHMLMTPFTANGIVTGYSSVFDHSTNVTGHDGEEWTQWMVNHTHQDSGLSFGTLLRHHPATGRHLIISEPEYVEVSNTSDPLQKRAPSAYTSYYGWRNDQDVQSIHTDKGTVDQLVAQVWNFGKDKNRAQFCANLVGNTQSNSFSRTLTHGSFALITGTFSDNSGNC